MSKTKIISIIIGVLVIAAAVFFFTRGKKIETAEIFKSLSEIKNEVESSLQRDSTSPGSPTSEVGSRTSNSGDLETYTNTDYGFSFQHPKGVNISSFAEGESGDMILAQKPGSRESLQIFISEFDEPGPVTPERIRQDLPGILIENPQEVLIGKSKNVQALIFFSTHESLGKTREVWFVGGGNLYQITTYADMDNFLGPILETLQFD